MSQRIGNIGKLNLIHATEESIAEIEEIENVGIVFYRKQTSHLLNKMNIENVGLCLEIPEGYTFVDEMIEIDESYLQSITEPVKLFAEDDVMIAESVQPEQLRNAPVELMVAGTVYCPKHLAGAVYSLFSEGTAKVKTYEEAIFRFEKGSFELTNGHLNALEKPLYLVVSGKLHFSPDLDMDLYKEKLYKLEVKGLVSVFESQEPYFYQKSDGLKGKVDVIPDGYQVADKMLRINGRSIRRFKNAKLFTKKPILLEADVTREQLSHAFEAIHSSSIIVCQEELEDLVYERSPLLETEVLSYKDRFIFIEGEEQWTKEQLEALDHPAAFIVSGQLRFDDGVDAASLAHGMASLDILGEVVIPSKSVKGELQKFVRVHHGLFREARAGKEQKGLSNLGELTL
ncbi:hypothetical protein MUN89_02650 [Halobacillus salinarum]|uniref:Uncharacterized protein n=1 Tax=Halobacillus salinarum TaxID=2932257 RepID=A0ABY4EK77_9BACI|nr:hypothetical protein [Halobacillus salinarum]UOQ44873.1 hypothetical protein MUN89_02650 [Halobacillus salinarum]